MTVEDEEWNTRREKLMSMLTEDEIELDLRLIMRELVYPNKRLLINDIHSIEKTLKNQGIRLEIKPASCGLCGFVFKQKEFDLKIPSRCPKCHKEKIEWPSVKVK